MVIGWVWLFGQVVRLLEPNERLSGNSVSVPSAIVTSGRGAKSETGMVEQVVWPHTRLEGRMTSPSFEKLSFSLLLIGELNIVNDNLTSEQERQSRGRQLKRVCHYVWKNCEWEQVREFHGGFLTGVEKAGDWSVDPTEVAAEHLFCCPKQSSRQVVYVPQQQYFSQQQYMPQQQYYPQQSFKQRWPQLKFPVDLECPDPALEEGGPYFCSGYGKQCDHVGGHEAKIGGRIRWARHVCAICLLDYHECNEHAEIDCVRPALKRRTRNRGTGRNAPGGAGLPGSGTQ